MQSQALLNLLLYQYLLGSFRSNPNNIALGLRTSGADGNINNINNGWLTGGLISTSYQIESTVYTTEIDSIKTSTLVITYGNQKLTTNWQETDRVVTTLTEYQTKSVLIPKNNINTNVENVLPSKKNRRDITPTRTVRNAPLFREKRTLNYTTNLTDPPVTSPNIADLGIDIFRYVEEELNIGKTLDLLKANDHRLLNQSIHNTFIKMTPSLEALTTGIFANHTLNIFNLLGPSFQALGEGIFKAGTHLLENGGRILNSLRDIGGITVQSKANFPPLATPAVRTTVTTTHTVTVTETTTV